MNESRRSNRDALPAPAKAPLSDPVPSSALQAFRTSSEAAPALPGVPRTRLPPSFIGQLRLTNGGVLSPPLDSSRLVAHGRLPVRRGRLHRRNAHLLLEQPVPHHLQRSGGRLERAGLAAPAAARTRDPDADRRRVLPDIQTGNPVEHDLHGPSSPPSGDPRLMASVRRDLCQDTDPRALLATIQRQPRPPRHTPNGL